MGKKQFIIVFMGMLSLSVLFNCVYEGTAYSDPTPKGGWIQEHIMAVPDIELYEPFFTIFGQRDVDKPVSYTYEEAVKLAGHSCGAIAGAWLITVKALEVLYPDEEIPVRGNIMVYAPGAENEWHTGVLGEVITYITGAAPKTGFSGAEFANGFPPPTPPPPPTIQLPPPTIPPGSIYPGDQVYSRRNKMVYHETFTYKTPPWQGYVDWKFQRIDTEAEVCIRFMAGKILPKATPDWMKLGAKIASGEAEEGDEAKYIAYWNQRVVNLFASFDNEDPDDDLIFECPTP